MISGWAVPDESRNAAGMVILPVIVALPVVVGAFAAFSPAYTGVILGGLIAAIGALLISRRVLATRAASASGFYFSLGIALVIVSLIRIETRDATAEAVGVQAAYEFGLQSIAAGLVLIGMLLNRSRLTISVPLLFWTLFGALAIISANWAPQAMLAVFKGGQLILVCFIVASAAAQFTDRYQAIRLLSWITLLTIVAVILMQVVTEGPGSLWGTFEYGRQRLTLLAIHPLILGGFAGAVAALLLVHSPRGIDWLAFLSLAAIPVLTNSRTAIVALCVIAVLYLFSVPANRFGIRIAQVATALTLISSLVIFLLVTANSPQMNLDAELFGYDSHDLRTLNGRIPLWSATFAHGQAQSDADLGLLAGHGFASFRHFGLDQFTFAGDAHNAAIQVLFELGALGLVVWLLAFAASGWSAMSRAAGLRAKFIAFLPLAYILTIQMMEASLADSRSFLLVVLLVYAHAGLVPSRQSDPATAESKDARSSQAPTSAHGTPSPQHVIEPTRL